MHYIQDVWCDADRKKKSIAVFFVLFRFVFFGEAIIERNEKSKKGKARKRGPRSPPTRRRRGGVIAMNRPLSSTHTRLVVQLCGRWIVCLVVVFRIVFTITVHMET